MAKHNELVKQGELIAIHFLKMERFSILETNWRWQKAEIDILIQDKKTLALVEVKTRSSKKFGRPEEAITNKKQSLMQDAAEAYLAEKGLDYEIRFDVVSIILDEKEGSIEHLKNAF